MIKNVFIFFFTIALTLPVCAQDPIFKISGKVIDDQTKLPLNNVNILINGTLQGTITDSNGLFELYYRAKSVIVSFSFIGYEKKFIQLKGSSNNPLTVTLSQKIELLTEFVISSSPIETVAKNKNSNILDYCFYNDNIALVTFIKNSSKSRLILITPNLDTLDIIDIPERPSRLFKDCLGNNHVVCKKNVYQIYFDSSKLHFLPPSSIETFEATLFPCIAEDSINLYFIKKHGTSQIEMDRLRIQTNNHILNYYYINKSNKQKNSMVSIADHKTIELREKEEQFLNKKEAVGLYRTPIAKEFDRLFAETILYKEVYAPLFILNDTVYIFDYINSKIQCYSSGKISKELEIKFHTYNHWKREMCVDEKSQRAYAIYESGGITELKEINLTNGLLKDSYKIPFPFIEKIKAHDNYIYFLYQRKDNIDSKFLSRLRSN